MRGSHKSGITKSKSNHTKCMPGCLRLHEFSTGGIVGTMTNGDFQNLESIMRSRAHNQKQLSPNSLVQVHLEQCSYRSIIDK